jgi:hypothetical protein
VPKNIVVRLIGGCGNQLFIYAFGFARAKLSGRELLIDNISGFGGSGDEYKSEYALNGLGIKGRMIGQSKWHYLIANRYFWFLVKILKIAYVEPSHLNYKDIQRPKCLFYEGYWQSYRYFDEYKEEIKNSLKLQENNENEIISYKKLIQEEENSVAIGMRFYEETLNASKYHLVKNDMYYLKAIELLESHVSNPKYFIFSTDIKRAKSIMQRSGKKNIVYINPIKDKANAKLDLYLMSLCDHFIISNGTFYWWAAYLGEIKKSIVIAPEEGFTNRDALPPNWLRF